MISAKVTPVFLALCDTLMEVSHNEMLFVEGSLLKCGILNTTTSGFSSLCLRLLVYIH